MVTIDQLVDIVEDIAGVKLRRRYDRAAPRGVNGRSSDNTLVKARLGWEPATPLRDGLRVTYDWIRAQMTGPRPGAGSEPPFGAIRPSPSRRRR